MTEARKNLRIIDLEQLRENIRVIRAAVPSSARLLCVVKADAYGHGMAQVAREAELAGADWLAVAITEEGAALRRAGITLPILVLGATTPDAALQGVEAGVTLTVCTPEMVRSVEAAALKLNRMGDVHIKIDSGMCRIGCRNQEEVRSVLAALAECPHVRLTGAFTHFADADREDEDMTFTRQQFDRFLELTKPLPEGIIRHCANSAAIHRCMPEMALDMVRAGITLYGYPPVKTDMPVRPFMRWETEVTHVKQLQPGDTVSYGRTFTADRAITAATCAVGYGDGYHRAMTGKAWVLIKGVRCPILGRICMDQIVVDASRVPGGVQPCDRVTLMGRDGEEELTAEDLAAWAGTISYEILLGATDRVPRVWENAHD